MNAIVHLWFWMLAEELAEVEARHDDQPRPRMQRGVEQHRHSVDVEERQHREDHVVGARSRAAAGSARRWRPGCDGSASRPWGCRSCPSCTAAPRGVSTGSKLTCGAGSPGASRSAALGCPLRPRPSPSSTTSSVVGQARLPRRPLWPAASSGLTVTSILAFESVSCLAMSLAVNSALMVVAVAPARRMPWKATAKRGTVGRQAGRRRRRRRCRGRPARRRTRRSRPIISR